MDSYNNIALNTTYEEYNVPVVRNLPSQLSDEQVNEFMLALNNYQIVSTSSFMFVRNFQGDFRRQLNFLPDLRCLIRAEKWLIPYHIYDNHWILLVVYLPHHLIAIYDSLISCGDSLDNDWPLFNIDDEKLDALDKVRSFLNKYGKYCRQSHFSKIPWKMFPIPLLKPQPDAVSCGLYMLRIAELSSQVPYEIIVNLGIYNEKTANKVLLYEKLLLDTQLDFLKKKRTVKFDVLDRCLFKFDVQYIEYNPVMISNRFYVVFSPEHIKELDSAPMQQIGECGVFVHYLPDVRLASNRSVPRSHITKYHKIYSQNFFLKKVHKIPQPHINWEEKYFDFMMDFSKPSYATKIATKVKQRAISRMSDNDEHVTIVSVDVNFTGENQDGIPTDFLSFERIICMVYHKLVTKCKWVRLIIVTEQVEKIYIYLRAWRFVCWSLNYNVGDDDTFVDWKKTDYLMNDQFYSLLTSFPLGFLHIILYKNWSEFIRDVDVFGTIDLFVMRNESTVHELRDRYKSYLEHVRKFAYFGYPDSQYGIPWAFFDSLQDSYVVKVIKL